MEQNKISLTNILMVLSGKGGVGKSTVTTLIAATLARRGCKV
jgi:Mrp family chromosome partitioning ATPase